MRLLDQAFNVAFGLTVGFMAGGILGASGDLAFNLGLSFLGGMWLTLMIIAVAKR